MGGSFFDRFNDCIVDEKLKRTRQRRVVLRERNRRYELLNRSELFVTKYAVENCIVDGQGQKGCEAILLAESRERKQYIGKRAFYVELKGCSVDDALEQIYNSLEKTKEFLQNVLLFGRIVPSEYKRNKFLTTKQQRLHLKFKATGGDLKIKESLIDEI